MEEGVLGDALLSAMGTLFRLGIAALIWKFAREMGKAIRDEGWEAYVKVVGACAFLAFLSWSSYGTHVEDADPIHGGGDVVEDFKPTKQQRDEHGLAIFFTITPLALLGFRKGQNEVVGLPDSTQTPEFRA